jgi:hypothetical protein
VLSSGATQVGTQTPVPGTNSVTFTGLVPGGSYTVHIQAAGYQFGDSGTSVVTLDCGSGAATITINPGATTTCTATLIRDAAITGTVSGILALSPDTTPTSPIVGATVTAKRCLLPVAATTYCTQVSTTDVFTTITDSAGGYRLIGSSAHRLDAGNWLVATTAAGYTATGVPAGAPAGALAGTLVAVAAAVDTTFDPAIYITPVTFTVSLKDQNNKALAEADLGTTSTVSLIGPSTTATVGSSIVKGVPVWSFTNVIPGSYTLQVVGESVVTVTNQVNVVLGVATQTYTMIVPLGANQASGTISGLQGPAQSATPLLDAVVCLFTTANPPSTSTTCGALDSPDSTVAKGVDTLKLITSTDVDGNFSLGTVPDGKYYLQVQKVGYQNYFQTSVVSYKHTQAAPPAVIQTLTRITHNVVVSVTTTASGDNIGSSALSLTSSDFAGWVPLSNPAYTAPAVGSKTHTWIFTAVPFGNWTLKVVLPGNHFGVVTSSSTNGGPTMNCIATTPAQTPASQTCTSTLTVPGSGLSSTPVPAGYQLDEYQPTIAVTATALALDTAPTSVTVTVGPTASPLYTSTGFLVSATASALGVWVNGTQTVTADANLPGWAPLSPPVTSATATTIPLVEVGATVTVTVHLNGARLPNNQDAQVTLTPPPGSTATAPTPISKTGGPTGETTATFTLIPYGTGWTAGATGTVTVVGPPASTTPVQGSATFTVNGATASVTVNMIP